MSRELNPIGEILSQVEVKSRRFDDGSEFYAVYYRNELALSVSHCRHADGSYSVLLYASDTEVGFEDFSKLPLYTSHSKNGVTIPEFLLSVIVHQMLSFILDYQEHVINIQIKTPSPKLNYALIRLLFEYNIDRRSNSKLFFSIALIQSMLKGFKEFTYKGIVVMRNKD